MIDNFFIFGARELYLLSVALAAIFIYRSPREKQKEILIFACISLPIAYLLALLAREFYFNPRPFVVGDFEPLIAHAADNGFPSDHTLLTAALASLASFFHRRWALALWIIAILVGISRVYVGVHHLTDILGSILIALAGAALAYAIIQKLWSR